MVTVIFPLTLCISIYDVMHINIIPVLATGLAQILHLPASTQVLKIVSKFVDMPVMSKLQVLILCITQCKFAMLCISETFNRPTLEVQVRSVDRDLQSLWHFQQRSRLQGPLLFPRKRVTFSRASERD